MHKKARLMSLVSVISAVTMLFLVNEVGWRSFAQAASPSGKQGAASQPWAIVRVELPASDGSFPPGAGADIAASQCLICHSAGMVLTQPPLTKAEWRAEIMKMRSSYGAPIPDDQVDGLSEYLKGINGRQ
jgi:mono/diheme cytochrome c family protein